MKEEQSKIPHIKDKIEELKNGIIEETRIIQIKRQSFVEMEEDEYEALNSVSKDYDYHKDKFMKMEFILKDLDSKEVQTMKSTIQGEK